MAPTSASEQTLVIGAGPSGISAAYYLEQAGISYRVVDRADKVASTWSSLYPSLRLNTAGFVSNLPGQPIPLKQGIYPLGSDFYRYVVDYVSRRPFKIELSVNVTRVAPEGDGWLVKSTRGTEHYRFVIIATGRFGNPYLPDIPGMSSFTGRCLHANDYHAAEPFRGQRVLVVGNGPSGGDIAVELTEVTRHPVLLAICSDIVFVRPYPYGLPNAAWILLAGVLPKAWRKRFLTRVLYHPYHDLHDLDLPIAPNRQDRVGTSAPVRGHELVDAIRAGKVKAVTGLARLEGRCAVLDDGSSDEVDSVIFCTGYRPVLDYLDIDYQTDRDGWPQRSDAHGTEIAGYSGLFLVGRYYRGLGPLYNIRREARVTADVIRARLRGEVSRLKLPDPLE